MGHLTHSYFELHFGRLDAVLVSNIHRSEFPITSDMYLSETRLIERAPLHLVGPR